MNLWLFKHLKQRICTEITMEPYRAMSWAKPMKMPLVRMSRWPRLTSLESMTVSHYSHSRLAPWGQLPGIHMLWLEEWPCTGHVSYLNNWKNDQKALHFLKARTAKKPIYHIWSLENQWLNFEIYWQLSHKRFWEFCPLGEHLPRCSCSTM